ncbi:MAG TPA: response regulator [Isosphaeraceae bacterium]|nr:response regulator [Isosphaeraceae bacterium]
MGTSARILIVDDEPNVRLVFRTALESAGYEIAEAADAEEALAHLKVIPTDLALVDLKMPGMGGMELLRHLHEVGCKVPVVVITAHGTIVDAVEAMKLGAIDFLVKPLRPESLRQLVTQVMATHAKLKSRSSRPRPTPTFLAKPMSPDLEEGSRALERGQFSEAERLLCRVIEKDPDSAEAHNLLGTLHERLGEVHTAYHSYKAALASDPSHEYALKNIKRYCERFGLDFNSPLINPGAK